MALFNESLEGRFNKLITRMHGMKGFASAPQIAPEITHSVTIENDRPEQLIHQDTSLWCGRVSVAALAANFSIAGVRNPVGSGQIVIVTGIVVSNDALVAGIFTLLESTATNTTGALLTVGGTFYRDSRRGFSGNGPAKTVSGQLAATTGAVGPVEAITLAATQGDEPLSSPPFILTPGFDLLVVPSAVNLGVDADFFGYARALASADLFT